MRTKLEHTLVIAAGVVLGALALRGGIGLLSPAARADVGAIQKPIIAVCAVPTLMNELMASDRYRPAREEAAADVRTELEGVAKELQQLREGLQGSDPKAGDAPQRIQRYQELSGRASQLQQQLIQAVNHKMAEQLGECYELVRASADAVAEKLGFEYVIATGGIDEKFSPDNPEVTLRQITARPVVRYPKSADITDDVRDDLKLD